MIDEILAYNRAFVTNKGYKPYTTSKYPDRKLAIVTCMDTRLIELLPAALGIKNGDAKIIKNAGGVTTHPYGSVVRSLLVAILELGVEEIMVIGHTDCGVQGMDAEEMLEKLISRGIPKEHIDIVRRSGIDLNTWLGGFSSSEESVSDSTFSPFCTCFISFCISSNFLSVLVNISSIHSELSASNNNSSVSCSNFD